MGYKPSKHYNALYKLVREKEYILQLDAAKRFNMKSSSGIKAPVEQLVNEGRIKRVKVKSRQKNGNLNDTWLLYIPNTDYNKILDYEKELINQPFESPLKEHHCYKTSIEPAQEFSITETDDKDGKVINLHEYIKINDYDLSVKEYSNQRVVTTQDIAKAHKKTVKAVNQQLERNKNRLILNEDYFIIDRENLKVTESDFEKYFTSNRQKELYLFSESRYMMLVKTFNDDLSWQVQRQLVNTYFKMKEYSKQNELAPIPQNEIQSLDILEMMIKEMKKQNERVDNLENKLNTIVKVLSQ